MSVLPERVRGGAPTGRLQGPGPRTPTAAAEDFLPSGWSSALRPERRWRPRTPPPQTVDRETATRDQDPVELVLKASLLSPW